MQEIDLPIVPDLDKEGSQLLVGPDNQAVVNWGHQLWHAGLKDVCLCQGYWRHLGHFYKTSCYNLQSTEAKKRELWLLMTFSILHSGSDIYNIIAVH